MRQKKITVVGMGLSGKAAAALLRKEGAFIRITDNKDNEDVRIARDELSLMGIECEIGAHTEGFLEGTELMVVSPGVENSSVPVRWARERGVPVISEIELGYRLCPARIVAVSGTNGKSTVVSIIGQMLKDAGINAIVCGNIGIPFTSAISSLTPDSVIVLEVSSFQLERTDSFKPFIAVMLNMTEDHLDRYAGFDEYANAKLRLFHKQDGQDYAIINYDQARLRGLRETLKANVAFFSKHRLPDGCDGAYIENNELIVRKGRRYVWLAGRESLSLSGEHNLENSLASGLAGFILGIDADRIKGALYGFRGLKHRFELVNTFGGIRFIDDSKATNIESTRRAIQSSPKAIILIAGGRDKGGDYGIIRKVLKDKVRALFLIGEAKEKIAAALSGTVPISSASDLKEAVKEAYNTAKRGDTILLSPMCSSFDMFRDYKERGDAFRQAVEGLKSECAE